MTDWQRATESPAFKELVAARRRFVLPATIGFLAWFTLFILLCGYAEDFMGETVTGGLTVGYLWALSQFVMVWVLGFLYLRQSDKVFEPLRREAVKDIERWMGDGGTGDVRTGRFDRNGGGGSSPGSGSGGGAADPAPTGAKEARG